MPDRCPGSMWRIDLFGEMITSALRAFQYDALRNQFIDTGRLEEKYAGHYPVPLPSQFIPQSSGRSLRLGRPGSPAERSREWTRGLSLGYGRGCERA